MILISFGLLILQGISDAIKNWAIYTGRITVEPVTPPLSLDNSEQNIENNNNIDEEEQT